MTQPGTVEIDLHGKNKYQARITLDSALRKAGGSVYRIRVIHGHTLGTELRDMVREEYKDHPKVVRISKGLNDGQTDLIIRER